MKTIFLSKIRASLILLVILFTINFKSLAIDVTIGTSTSNGSTNVIPAYGYYDYGWSAMLYSHNEIGSAGTITSLQFQQSNSVNYTLYSQYVYMAVVSDSVFNSTAYITPTSVGATLVYSGNTSWNGTGFHGITLQTPFVYNGTGNLLVLWENRDGSYSSGNPNWYYTTTTNSKAKYRYKDGSFPTSSGNLVYYRPNTKISYTPAYSNNLTLSNWVYPQTGTSASSSMPISIKVSNIGSASQSGYTIKYSINNGASYNSQVISATLVAGNSVNLTFTTPANMSAPGTYQCIAIVKNPGDTIPSDDTIRNTITICGGQYSGSYTVGSGSSDNFPSIQDALNAFQICGMSSSVILKVKPGTYNGKVVLPNISGLSLTKNITIESYSGIKDVVLTYTGTSGTPFQNSTVYFDSANFYHLKNLKIEVSGTTSANALVFDYSSNNTIENCEITGDLNSSNTSKYFSTIYLSNTSYSYSNQNRFINNTIQNGSYGIYMNGLGTSTLMYGTKIIGNRIINFNSYGIYSTYNDSILIENNEIIGSRTTNSTLIYLNYSSNKVDVRRNKIELHYGYGIYCNYNLMAASNPLRVYNNFIYGFPMSTSSIVGLYFYNGTYNLVDNNSVYFTNPNSISATNYGAYFYYGSAYTLRNNSIVNESSSYALYVHNSTFNSIDYNNYYSNGSYIAYYNNNITSLSALQSASTSNYNSVSSTGVYYSSTNLHSNSSSLNDLGTPSTFVTTDFDGQTRSSSTPDIGADEFTIQSNDGGLLSFNGLNNQCAGTPVALKVTLKNFGTQSITSAYISVKVRNTVISNSWSGFLSPGSSSVANIGNYSFSADSVYQIIAWVDSVNHNVDGNAYNDTLIQNNYRTSLSGNYSVGNSASADFATINAAVNALYQYGICGPVVFNIESGTYTGNYSIITAIPGSSATNTVTFKSATNNSSDVILTYNSQSTSDNYIFDFQNVSNIKVKNLNLKNTGIYYNKIINLSTVSNIEISNNIINSTSTNSSYSGDGIKAYDASYISVLNNNFLNNINGIYITGNSSSYSNGIQVQGNHFTNFTAYGFYGIYVDTVIIRGNEFTSMNTSQNVYGIYLYYLNNYLEISKNKVSLSGNSYVYGIRLYYVNYSGNSNAHQVKVFNNFVSVTSTTSYAYGVYIYNTYYPKLYFNTLNAYGTYSNYPLYSYYGFYLTSYNNIFAAQNGYAAYYYNGSISASDYNEYYNNYTYLIYKNSYYTSLASFQSYTGLDIHSKNVIPNFASNTDLHIFNQLLNNAGSSYGGVVDDIDGETRSLTLPDIGADEYSILTRDVKPIAVNSPQNPAAIGNNAVKVAILNQGTSTLYSANIYYKVDGGTTHSTYWTGSVSFLGIDSLINLGSESFTAGSHSLKVWTGQPNGLSDLNPSNDTINYNFTAIAKPIIAVSPSSISDSILSCTGTKVRTVKVYNIGSANLTVTVPASLSSGNTINILTLTVGYDSYSYANAKAVILAGVTNAQFTESSTTSASTLSSLLVGKQIVLIPKLINVYTATTSAYTAFAPVLQNFVSNGGTVIFLGSQSSYASHIWNTGLWSGSYYGYLGSGYSVTINQSSHPLFANLSSSYLYSTYYYDQYIINNSDATTLASYSYPIISERHIGNGKTILLGIDYYYTTTDGNTVLTNAINYGALNSSFITNSAISQTILPGDSTVLSFTLNATGLVNGWHTNNITLSHNDQSQSLIVVPCSLYVQGTPDIRFNSNYHSFGSVYTGTSITDSIYVYNDGCSNLSISNITSNNSYLIPMSTTGTIAAGDSMPLAFKFQPAAAGSYAMTATVFNNDANYTLNFAGSAALSPQISLSPNPLNATIVNCNDSITIPVTITNTGGVALSGSVSPPSDSLKILMLTYGGYSTSVSNLATALGYSFTKFILTQSNITSNSQLQTAIQGKDVVVIPYINNSSYQTIYATFATTLQSFVNAGGTIIYSGQYYANYLTSSGFFTGSYVGYSSGSTVSANTSHFLSTGLTSSFYAAMQFFYYNLSTSGWSNLVTYSSYTVAGTRSYGAGLVVLLGFNYSNMYTGYYEEPQKIVSNALQYTASQKATWVNFTPYNFTLNANSSAVLNVKFLSANKPTGTYTSNISFTSNDPVNPTKLLPCTLNVQNQIPNAVNLGPDTTYCGPKVLDAGSGFSSYLWNTGNTTQTITASSSGFYMVTVTNGGSCFARDTVLLTINPLPNVNIPGLPTTACTNGQPINMTGTPSGGGFIGSGILGSTFYPANVSTGPHNITYTYTNTYGCTGNINKTITVYNPPTVSFSGLSSTYCPQGLTSTLVGTPSGGSYSGLGISGNIFNPYLAGAGNHSVIYSYTDIHGCSNTDTSTTVVKPYIQANITGYSTDYCANSPNDTLISSISNTTFSGSGVSGNIFSPSSVSVGNHNIYYSYTDINSCSYTDTLVVNVHALPSNVSISGLNTDYCINSGDEYMNGFPLGGTFSGPGVVGNLFYPNLAGAGNHTVVYTYTNVYGCKNTASTIVGIHALPTITIGNIQPNYCINSGIVNITPTPAGGTLSGTGVTASTFNPQTAGLGTHYISYSYTNSWGCSNIDSIAVTVYALPSVSFSNLPTSSCSNGNSVNLVGNPLGGTFSGSGMLGNTFKPSLASTGNNIITYTFTDNHGCANNSQSTVNIIATQQVNIGVDQTINYNTSTQFNPIISGGTGSFVYLWTPANKVTNAAILNPPTVNLAATTIFTLKVTDNNTTCFNSDTATVHITGGALAVILNSSQTSICNGESVQIVASGSGGNGTYNYSWSSNPVGFTSTSSSINVAPTATTTYTCAISDGTLNSTSNIIITVKTVPNANINNLATSYCSNEPSVSIVANPSGGTLSGSGINGNIFNPANALLGTNMITYSLTASNGCSNTDTVYVQIKSAPTAFAGIDTTLPCQNGGIQLGQQPFNGIGYLWYPALGLNNPNISNPVSSPNYGITYILTSTNIANGCSSKDTVNITVLGGPNTIASNDTIICKGGIATLHISGGTSYQWSTGASTNSIMVNPLISTQYFVVSTQSNCANLDTILVTVNNPKPHLGKDTTICGGNSILVSPGIFTSYLWSTGDNTPYISVDSSGVGLGSKNISVKVTDNIGCFNRDTIVISFNDCTGILEGNGEAFTISAFPNPTDGILNIYSSKTDVKRLNYEISDINGKIILAGKMKNSNGYFTERLNLSVVAKGLYFIKLTADKSVQTLKIAVQ